MVFVMVNELQLDQLLLFAVLFGGSHHKILGRRDLLFSVQLFVFQYLLLWQDDQRLRVCQVVEQL